MQCRGIGPHLVAKGKSRVFSRVAAGSWGVFLRYGVDCTSKIMFFSATSGHLSSNEGHLGNYFEAWQGNRDTSRREAGNPGPLSSSNMDIEIPINSQEESHIFTFRSIEFHMPLEVQRDVRPPVEVRRGPKASSSVCTKNSLNPSSCKMKDQPAFKPLQENPAFFRDRASRSPFHLRHQTPGPSHIPTVERNLLLRCLSKVALLLYLKPENQLPSRDDLGYSELSSCCCAERHVPLVLGW